MSKSTEPKIEYQASIISFADGTGRVALNTTITETRENDIISNSPGELLDSLNRLIAMSMVGRLVWASVGCAAIADGGYRMGHGDWLGILESGVGVGFVFASCEGFRGQIGRWQVARRNLVEKLNSNFTTNSIIS